MEEVKGRCTELSLDNFTKRESAYHTLRLCAFDCVVSVRDISLMHDVIVHH